MPQIAEAKWTAASRRQYLKDHPENFAGPNGSFPIRDSSDVGDAWGLAGHADNPDAVRAKIKKIAARLGLSHGLPDTAKDDAKEESTATIADSIVRPRKKIATLNVCYLEYNARSLNGRIYPKATCDAIHASLQRKLADSNALPMTCFISHEAANNNVNTQLVGAISGGSQEGSKFYALIDLADTSVAHDQLALVEGGYMRSESMRVLGVELMQDRNHDLSLVVPIEGVEPELLGIDLTTRPGLMDTARIQQVLYESSTQAAPYTESFSLDSVLIESKEAPMSIPLYFQIIAGTLSEAVTADRAAHGRIHDHLAGVMDEAVKAMHGSESARLIAAAALSEEGRAIAMKHAARLSAAHDEAARQMGMACEGCYKEALGIPLDPDQDGDVDAVLMIPDDDGDEEAKKGTEKPMNEAEMLAALKAKGYNIVSPKTVEEQIAELKALSEAQAAQIEALRAGSGGAAPPQRQTQAAPSQMQESSTYEAEPMYREGDYLQTSIHPKHWGSLSGQHRRAVAESDVHQNRAVPWPKDAGPWSVVKELAPFMAYGMLQREAAMMNRDVSMLIGQNEVI